MQAQAAAVVNYLANYARRAAASWACCALFCNTIATPPHLQRSLVDAVCQVLDKGCVGIGAALLAPLDAATAGPAGRPTAAVWPAAAVLLLLLLLLLLSLTLLVLLLMLLLLRLLLLCLLHWCRLCWRRSLVLLLLHLLLRRSCGRRRARLLCWRWRHVAAAALLLLLLLCQPLLLLCRLRRVLLLSLPKVRVCCLPHRPRLLPAQIDQLGSLFCR